MVLRIDGFPPDIEIVPETKREYVEWRDKVLVFRELCHRMCEKEGRDRDAIMLLAAKSKAFWFCVFGVILDPKGGKELVIDPETNELVEVRKKRGWYPFILYPFQVKTINFHDEVMRIEDDESGKADGVVEKSRDMGLTWTFVGMAGHSYLFEDDYLALFVSFKEDLVDSPSPKSMFYKLRALIGLNRKVPRVCHSPGTPYHGARLRMPDWMLPQGFDPKLHDRKLSISHPTKTNQITGESTTSNTATGDRQNEVLLDEGSKNKELGNIWPNLTSVADHRFVFSSPDRRNGDGMYNLVEQARAAQRNPELSGPSLLSLPWSDHPLRDDARYRRTKARHADDPASFQREFELNWDAGIGDWVYPIAQKIVPGYFPYDPTYGDVYISIDPGIRDPTAIGCFQYIPASQNNWTVFDGLVINTPSAKFLAPILMGWPPGHPMRHFYPEYSDERIQQFMDTTWELRRYGRRVYYVGDPYGNNAGGAASEGYYTTLFLESVRLNSEETEWDGMPLPPARISVMTKYDEDARYHTGRKEALSEALPRWRFDDTPRVLYLVDAVKKYRYRSQDENRSVQNEPMTPLHDWTSHPTTMLEYFAVVNKIKAGSAGPQHRPTQATTRSVA